MGDSHQILREEIQMETKQILKIQEKQLCNQDLWDVLAQRKGYLAEDASGVDWNKLVAQFPYLQR